MHCIVIDIIPFCVCKIAIKCYVIDVQNIFLLNCKLQELALLPVANLEVCTIYCNLPFLPWTNRYPATDVCNWRSGMISKYSLTCHL